MQKKSRRGLLVAANAPGTPRLEKRSPYPPRDPAIGASLFSRAVAYGNLLFLSGIGNHTPRTIEVATRDVIEELEQSLIGAGSSLQKCLKADVFLRSLADYDAMNSVWRSYDWGMVPTVRTTVAPAEGIPGHSLIEIDVIAYI